MSLTVTAVTGALLFIFVTAWSGTRSSVFFYPDSFLHRLDNNTGLELVVDTYKIVSGGGKIYSAAFGLHENL